MVPVVFGRHSEDAGRRVPSLNVVAITVLLSVLAPAWWPLSSRGIHSL
jgi:hypothetical protein